MFFSVFFVFFVVVFFVLVVLFLLVVVRLPLCLLLLRFRQLRRNVLRLRICVVVSVFVRPMMVVLRVV